MDQPANELLEEVERMAKTAKIEGNCPLFCRLDDAVAEYCLAQNIHRVWVHCSRIGATYSDMARRLAMAGIKLVTTSPRHDREIQSLMTDAALAYRMDAPNKQEFLENLRRALEFFIRQVGAQCMLVDHWAWPILETLPADVGAPYLLSGTRIYLDKLTEMMFRYCQD